MRPIRSARAAHISAQGNDIFTLFFRCVHAILLWFTHSFYKRQNPLHKEIGLLHSQGKYLNQIESEVMARSGQFFRDHNCLNMFVKSV